MLVSVCLYWTILCCYTAVRPGFRVIAQRNIMPGDCCDIPTQITILTTNQTVGLDLLRAEC